MIYSAQYASPVGALTLAASENSLLGLWIEGQKHFFGTLTEYPPENHFNPVLQKTITWLDRYFSGEKPTAAELSLSPVGSAFCREVWQILCDIPYGQVVTYGKIAKELASQNCRKTMSAQAVGGAVGRNPISIIIPCHRVIGANGNLTGYAGGIKTKLELLKLEGVNTSRLFIPKSKPAL